MSTKARIRALEEEGDDAELSRLLASQPHSNLDRKQWLRDENGDLDWTYTAEIVHNWTQDAILTHLWENAFSIPPREYNPSAPFVYVKFHNGETVTLPHGYRLPLAFVAKYRWEMTLDKLKEEKTWKKERAAIFHLSRLCENLFQRARAKAFSGGMEKGWRCEMFDRLLARLYKSWVRNDPQSIKEFSVKHSLKEYDRDVLKHDWKRWCMRGLNGVRMLEEEVTNGILIEDFRKTLKKVEDGVWSIDGRPLNFITNEQEDSWSTTSELTDYEIEDAEGSDADAEGEVVTEEMVTVKRSPSTIGDVNEILPKRERDSLMGGDDTQRALKRVRIEDTVPESHHRYRFNHIYPLSRTLAAMHSNPIWSRTSPPASAPPMASSSKLPVAESVSAAGPGSRKLSPALDDVIIVSGPTKPKSTKKPQPQKTARANGPSYVESASSSIATARRPSKPRQTRAAQIAGVATVNLYVSDGKPKGGSASVSHKPTNKWQALTAPASGSKSYYRGKSSSQKKSASAIPMTASESKTSQDALPSSHPSCSPFPHPTTHTNDSNAESTSFSLHKPIPPFPQNVDLSSQTLASVSSSNPGKAENSLQTFKSSSDDPISYFVPYPAPSKSRTGLGPLPDLSNVASPGLGIIASPPIEAEHSPIVNHKEVPSSTAVTPSALPLPQPDLPAVSAASTSAPPAVTTFYPLPTWRMSPPPPPLAPAKMPSVEPRNAQQKQSATIANSGQVALSTGANDNKGDITAKALELLVNLIDAKQVLGDRMPLSTSSSPKAGPSSVSHSQVGLPPDERRLLESRINDVEGRFASVKEELVGILGRLQSLENGTKEMWPLGTKRNDVELVAASVSSRSLPSSLSTRTGKQPERGNVDVEMNGPECEPREQGSGGAERSRDTDFKGSAPSTVPQESLIVEEEKEALGATDTLPRQGTFGETQTTDNISGESEADTDTTVNVTSSALGSKDEVTDPRAQAMGSNLSLLVDNLVSTKMLSLMETMVKSKVKEPALFLDRERGDRSVSPSIVPPTPDPFLVVNLVDELRALKNDLRAKERRERQEMEEMRRLHVAEVDALRRRLSYLESQNRYLENQAQSNGGGSSSKQQHHHHNNNSSATHRSSSTHSEDRRNLSNRMGEGSSSSLKDGTPTPATSERNYSFARPDRDDELPLPIKSQRKNISFPRPSFG